MAFDPHGLLVYSTIQSGGVIGSTSGTTLQVYPGDSSKFSVNQNITVWPPGIDPNIGTAGIARNAEIMRIVTIDTQSDTLTVQRAQEGSTLALSTIAAGWQVANTISPKVMTDVESYTNPIGTINAYGGRVAPTGWLTCDGSAVSRTTYANLFAVLAASLGTVTCTSASPAVVTNTAHGLSTGDAIYLTGTAPTGLSINTLYYIVRIDANTYNLSTTRANAYASTKINTTSTGSGLTAWDCPYGLGDGSTTFTLPDLRGKVAAGMDTTGGVAAGNLSLAQTQGVYGNLGASGGEQGHTIVTAELASHTHSTTNLQNPNTGTNSGNGYFTTGGGNSAWSATTFLIGSNSSGGDTAHNNVQPVQLVNYIIKT